jgi:hypothetical protein
MHPQTIQDETLGVLTWNSQVEWWEGKQEITPGRTISITVSADDTPLDTVLERARRAYRHVQSEEPSLRRAAADALLALHNEEWNEGEPIDDDAFVSRMVLKDIAAYDDGSSEVSYDDGDLFWGHTIILSVDEEGTVQDAGIQG